MKRLSDKRLLGEIFKEQPDFDESKRTFSNFLPTLLKDHKGEWIAIAGEEVFPPRKSKARARQDAEEAEIEFGNYTVRLIEQDAITG